MRDVNGGRTLTYAEKVMLWRREWAFRPNGRYKAVFPHRFSISSLHPFSSFLLPFHFSAVPCLRPRANSTSPSVLPCRPVAPQKNTTKPVSVADWRRFGVNLADSAYLICV